MARRIDELRRSTSRCDPRGLSAARRSLRGKRLAPFARAVRDRPLVRQKPRTARPSAFRFSARLQSALPAERQRANSRPGSHNISTRANRRSWSSSRAQKQFRDDLPAVIRPDLVLTEDGLHHRGNRFGPRRDRSDRLAESNLPLVRRESHRRQRRNDRWLQELAAGRRRHRHFRRSRALIGRR